MTRGKEKSGNISIFGGMSHVISIRFACISTDMPNKRTVVLSALRHMIKISMLQKRDTTAILSAVHQAVFAPEPFCETVY